MDELIYNDDSRYPGPKVHPPPAHIKGIPTQRELDAHPRMFSWGELKEIVKSGDLERLMRNKALQARYDEWMTGIRAQYGSTEKYLTRARLPWSAPTDPAKEPQPTYDLSSSPTNTSKSLHPSDQKTRPQPLDLTPATNPHPHQTRAMEALDASHAATPGSGSSTPTSAGFVSLANLKIVNGKLKAKSKRGSHSSTPVGTPRLNGDGPLSGPSAQPIVSGEAPNGDEEDSESSEEAPLYLKWDPVIGLDEEKYAVLPNDWPYNVPYGVRHYCVWSRLPIAHPELVDYDPESWGRIEVEGIGGFSGVTPLRPFEIKIPDPSFFAGNPSYSMATHDSAGRTKFLGKLDDRDWYAADVAYAGKEMSQWGGVEYESPGGSEVGKMVRGLWDPRGWECLWFVNPPRLQSVPGFSHFHVFARRKTPPEIDASEAFDDTYLP